MSIISLDDGLAVTPRNRPARIVATVSRSIEDELVNMRSTTEFGDMVAEADTTDRVLWGNHSSRVFVFSSPSHGEPSKPVPASDDDISRLLGADVTVTVHNPPSPVRQPRVVVDVSAPQRFAHAATRSPALALLSPQAIAAFERIFTVLTAIPAWAWTSESKGDKSGSPRRGLGVSVLSAVTIVVTELNRFDRDYDLTEPLSLVFMNAESHLVSSAAFEALQHHDVDGLVDGVLLAMRSRHQVRRGLRALPSVASLLPSLELTMPEVADRISLVWSVGALEKSRYAQCRVFATESLLALLELQAVVDQRWVEHSASSTHHGPNSTRLLRFVDVERLVRVFRHAASGAPIVSPRLVADALGSCASLHGMGALQYHEYQQLLVWLVLGSQGAAETSGGCGLQRGWGIALKTVLLAPLATTR
jgi:hypothetical protein